MKKIIFICLFALVSSLAVTSCTDEVVAPQGGGPSTGGGGGGSDPLPKP